MYKVLLVDGKDQTQILMGGHGLEEVCMKSMGVSVDSKQLNMSTREANVIFDYINTIMISKMRQVKLHSVQNEGGETPFSMAQSPMEDNVFFGDPFSRGTLTPQHA